MERIYYMPVRVKIDSENPDKVMRGIAEAIRDAIEKYMSGSFNEKIKFCDVAYSIYIKADEQTFAQQ